MTMTKLMEESNSEHFVVDSDTKALWAIRKINEYKEEREMLVRFYQKQIEKAEQEEAFHVDRLMAKLEDYAATLPMKSAKTIRSYELPGAKLVFKKPHAVISHDDEKIIKALKAKGDLQFIKTVEKLDWAGLKKKFQEDGEAVDGISIEIEPESFELRITKGDTEE